MKVCIAEKPSVAREIAFQLGAKSRKDGYFEGNGYQVTWTFGHLCTLKEPDDYQADWKKWSLLTLPIQPPKFETKLLTNKGVKKQFSTIKKLLKKATVVINCGDAGQEGELIQRWVLNQAKYKGKVLRLWISSLTPEAIKEGFQHLKNASEYDNLYYAGFSRAIGDWLLGMNATRLYTLKYGGYRQVLSVGRVQTPTLAMLVQRHTEIQNFKPEPFWELITTYRATQFSCEKGRFQQKEEGEKWLQQVEEKPFSILDFSKKKGKETPPRLFDLTSLQVHCNKRFGYSAEHTLKHVQSLYEKKVVTYPRVDTTYLPNDMYPKVAGILGKLNNYSQFTQSLLQTTIRKSQKVFNDKKVTDHHAIIPTGVEKSLPLTEQNVYDAITRRFIAAFYPDCIVANTVVIGGVQKESDFAVMNEKFPDYITFKVTGKEILDSGWRVLFPKSKKKNNQTSKKIEKEKEEQRILPSFKVGESGPHQPSLLEKQTQPPKYYTEATLLRAMETAGKKVEDDQLRDLMKANGIGRPSTRANIIETLFRRRYAKRQKKLIIPTELGVQLIALIKNDLLKSVELTGQWEKQLRDIETGKYSVQAFVTAMRTMVNQLVEEVKTETVLKRLTNNNQVPKQIKRKPAKKDPIIVGQSCPKCQEGTLLKGKEAYGCSNWKTGCTFRLPFIFKKKQLPILQLQRLLEYGATIQLRGFEENGKKFNANLAFDDSFNLIVKPRKGKKTPSNNTAPVKTRYNTKEKQQAISPILCPKCKTGLILKGKTAYGCSNWQSGCDFRYSFDAIRQKAKGQKLTRELIRQILMD